MTVGNAKDVKTAACVCPPQCWPVAGHPAHPDRVWGHWLRSVQVPAAGSSFLNQTPPQFG